MDALPHINAALNAISTGLLLAAIVAIRQGKRELHPRLILAALGVGVLFVVGYVIQVTSVGHQRFPGDDWVRTVFLAILLSHTALAIATVPLVIRTLYLAAKRRHDAHRRIARVTAPIWLYVGTTGLVVYAMNNFVRPAG